MLNVLFFNAVYKQNTQLNCELLQPNNEQKSYITIDFISGVNTEIVCACVLVHSNIFIVLRALFYFFGIYEFFVFRKNEFAHRTNWFSDWIARTIHRRQYIETMYPAKPRQKSNQKDVNNLVPSISMPSLATKPQQLSVAIKSPFDMQHNSWQMKHKTAAETISETRRMLSNGILGCSLLFSCSFFLLIYVLCFYYFLARSIPHLALTFSVPVARFSWNYITLFHLKNKCIECVQSFICRAYTQTQKTLTHTHTLHVEPNVCN